MVLLRVTKHLSDQVISEKQLVKVVNELPEPLAAANVLQHGW